jgi:hypothetical protein
LTTFAPLAPTQVQHLLRSPRSRPPSLDVPAARSREAVIAGVIGNTPEWYDFAVYDYFRPMVGFAALNPPTPRAG